MSGTTQQAGQVSRFRLARVDTPGARIPPLAAPVVPEYSLQSSDVSSALEAIPPVLATLARNVELADLRAAELDLAPLEPELIEQAQALLFDDPPAPVAGPVHAGVSLEPAAPQRATLAGTFPPVPFAPDVVSEVQAELETLHSRIGSGTRPQAVSAAAAAAPAGVPAATPAQKQPPADAKPPVPVKPKITIRPAEPAKPARPEPRRPATMVARGSAQPANLDEPEPKATPAPITETKVIPIRKADPAAPKPQPEMPEIALTPAVGGSSSGLKVGFAVAALLVLSVGGWLFFGRESTAASSVATVADSATPLPSLGGAGWDVNWGADAASNSGMQISLYRPTMSVSDYRIELLGQIERKALGWVFRAKDPRNYYVLKLEQIKPGVNPVVALVKYAVIDGKEGTRTQTLLPIQAAMTTMFKVRTDVKGDKFTTWVQDQVVDYWTDSQLTTGGAGLLTAKGERALIKTVNISGLR